MTKERWQILIAHAEDEEDMAERIAKPLRAAGYEVAHRGTVLVGNSILAEASKVLSLGGPVVVCATITAIGTGWANEIVQVARNRGAKIFVIRMHPKAYTSLLAADEVVAEYWKDPKAATKALLKALQKHYPLIKRRGVKVRPGVHPSTPRSKLDAHSSNNFINNLQRVIELTQPSTNAPSFLTFLACLAAIICVLHPSVGIVVILAMLAIAALLFAIRAMAFSPVKPLVAASLSTGVAVVGAVYVNSVVITAPESPTPFIADKRSSPPPPTPIKTDDDTLRNSRSVDRAQFASIQVDTNSASMQSAWTQAVVDARPRICTTWFPCGISPDDGIIMCAEETSC